MICSGCKRPLPDTDFHRNGKTWDRYCKVCRSEYMKLRWMTGKIVQHRKPKNPNVISPELLELRKRGLA